MKYLWFIVMLVVLSSCNGTPPPSQNTDVISVTGTLTTGDSAISLKPDPQRSVQASYLYALSGSLKQSTGVKLEKLNEVAPAPFPADDLIRKTGDYQITGNYKVYANSNLTDQILNLSLWLPKSNQGKDFNLIYTYDGSSYRKIGAQYAYFDLEFLNRVDGIYLNQLSSGITAPGYSYGIQVIVVSVSSIAMRGACENSQFNHWNGIYCEEYSWIPPSNISGQADFKNLRIFTMNAGNSDIIDGCSASVYVYKLCDNATEELVRRKVAKMSADIVMFQEVFNDDCSGVTNLTPRRNAAGVPALYNVEAGTICHPDVLAHRSGREMKQIERILDTTTYDYRCSQAKTWTNGRKYSGYECIAIKKSILEFAVNYAYLYSLEKNCELTTPVNPPDPPLPPCATGVTCTSPYSQNGLQSSGNVSPQATGGTPDCTDTGIYLMPVRFKDPLLKDKVFWVGTVHMINPLKTKERTQQLEMFERWVRGHNPKYLLAGDFNTDPSNDSSGLQPDTGRATFNRLFASFTNSTTLSYDPTRLGSRIGFTYNPTINPANNQPFTTAFVIGSGHRALDHVVSNFMGTGEGCLYEKKISNRLDHDGWVCNLTWR